jgi:hypothetical protein
MKEPCKPLSEFRAKRRTNRRNRNHAERPDRQIKGLQQRYFSLIMENSFE